MNEVLVMCFRLDDKQDLYDIDYFDFLMECMNQLGENLILLLLVEDFLNIVVLLCCFKILIVWINIFWLSLVSFVIMKCISKRFEVGFNYMEMVKLYIIYREC